jgi:hypothetical protein
MPVVIRTREYGSPQSYKELLATERGGGKEQTEKDIEELWG